MRGYIYILYSEERPGIVKIGKTTKTPHIRCKEHNNGWYLSINSWSVVYWRWVENCTRAEVDIHKDCYRYNLRAKKHKEAFRLSINDAKKVVAKICDNYPAVSDKKLDPIMKHKNDLDMIAYKSICKNNHISQVILNNKKIMEEVDFYKWLHEIRHLL